MALVWMGLFPTLAQGLVEPFTKLNWQIVRLAFPVEGDCLANIIHDHLAGIAAGHVPLKLFADGRIRRPVDVVVQHAQQFLALHFRMLNEMEPAGPKKLQIKPNRADAAAISEPRRLKPS